MAYRIFATHRRAILDTAAAYCVAALIISAVVAAWKIKGIPVGHFTRDPANTFDYDFYIGSVSYLGIILWTATAAICIFSGIILRSWRVSQARTEMSSFFLASGVLTLALLFDDAFLFHEIFFPTYLGISDYVTFSAYATITLAYLLYFRKTILNTHFLVLGVAGMLLGLGMVVDKLMDNSADTSIKFLVEDGIKFFGISTWFVYFIRLAIDQCRKREDCDY
jgi:hypothetical protein